MKKLFGVITIALLGFSLTACNSNSGDGPTNQDPEKVAEEMRSKNSTSESNAGVQDLKEEYVAYANESALPTEDIDAVTLEGETMTFEFAYNGQFGKYMQTLREGGKVDDRLKEYFSKHDSKTVILKSDVGNMILGTDYGVKFKS